MEKERVQILKITGNQFQEKEDDVALEYQYCLRLKDGREISISCTPTHMEELSLGRRFLLGDLAGEIKPVHADPVEKFSRLPRKCLKIRELFFQILDALTVVCS